MKIVVDVLEIASAHTGSTIGIEDRDLKHLLVGTQLKKKVIDLVEDLGRTSIRPVDLVDYDYHRKILRKSLLENESCLWQRPLGCIAKEDYAVDHAQAALDLTTKVGMPRRVDYVDLHTLPVNRTVLCTDSYATLPLDCTGIHDPVLVHVLADKAALMEQSIDKRSLAMVDMSDDGDVSYSFITSFHRNQSKNTTKETLFPVPYLHMEKEISTSFILTRTEFSRHGSGRVATYI